MNVVVGRRPNVSGGFVLDKFSLYYPDNTPCYAAWAEKWDLLQGYSFRTAALSGSLNRAGLNGLRYGSIRIAEGAPEFSCDEHGLIIDDESAYEDCAYVKSVEGESAEARAARIDGMVRAMVDAYGSQGILSASFDPAEQAAGLTALEGEWNLLQTVAARAAEKERAAAAEAGRKAAGGGSGPCHAEPEPELEPEPSTSTVVCVGDLHGHIDKATKVWAALEAELGEAGLAAATVVFLGDYVDRGPNTKDVLDWLIWLEASRAPGSTHFIAGNHDFAFGCFLGCLEVNPPGFDLDGTKDPKFTAGYWAPEVEGGMHYQGRRWGGDGGSDAYSAMSTFASYGVPYSHAAEARDALIAAVPQAHKDFLRRLLWVYDAPVPFPPGRLVCVHAGLLPGGSLVRHWANRDRFFLRRSFSC